MLSDDVLKHIFCLYREAVVLSLCGESWPQHEWCALTHVSQRWRQIIFVWPNYLDIRICCTSRTAAVKALNVWPALPISIRSVLHIGGTPNCEDGNGIVGALERRDRIVGNDLSSLAGPQLETCTTFMQEPFSILRALSLDCDAETPPVISDMFLAGSAPHLQKIKLRGVPFPTLPKFLSSTRDLVELHFKVIPRTGYISPEVMVTSLAMLTKLQSVSISFQSRKTQKPNILSHRHGLSFLPSPNSFLVVSANTWRTSWLESVHLYSITSTSTFSINPPLAFHSYPRSFIVTKSSRHPVKPI